MRHFTIAEDTSKDCSHYAVGHDANTVLVQLSDSQGEQVRVQLSIQYAKHLIELLEINIGNAKRHRRI